MQPLPHYYLCVQVSILCVLENSLLQNKILLAVCLKYAVITSLPDSTGCCIPSFAPPQIETVLLFNMYIHVFSVNHVFKLSASPVCTYLSTSVLICSVVFSALHIALMNLNLILQCFHMFSKILVLWS